MTSSGGSGLLGVHRPDLHLADVDRAGAEFAGLLESSAIFIRSKGEENRHMEEDREQHGHGRPPAKMLRTGQPVGPAVRANHSMNSRRPCADYTPI